MEEVWLQAQSNLAKVLTHQTFNTWIEPIKYLGSKKNVLLLEAPNQFVRDRVSESYLPMILESVQSLTDSQTKIELLIAKPKTEKPKQPAASEVTAAEPEACSGPDHSTNLNPKYTFDTFVCGGSNQFAHAAAQWVANNSPPPAPDPPLQPAARARTTQAATGARRLMTIAPPRGRARESRHSSSRPSRRTSRTSSCSRSFPATGGPPGS